MEPIKRALRDARIAAWVSLVPLTYFAAEWVVSASWRGHYGYREDLLGPLGVAFCGPEGNWPCSDLYLAMNVVLVVTGLAIAFVAAGLAARRQTERVHAVLLTIAGLALAASGIITQQVSYPGNLTVILMFLTLGGVSILLIGVWPATALPIQRRRFAAIAGLTSLIGYFAFYGQLSGADSGGAQRLAIYSILVAVVALGTSGFRDSSAEASAAELAEELP